MLAYLFSNWTSLLLVLLGVGYLILIQYLAKKEARPRKLNEAELLAKLARIGPHTEYDIFTLAADDWRVTQEQIEEDFKTYLTEGTIPYYVNAYLRQKAQEIGQTYRPPFLLGGGSLPWLK